MDGTRKYDNTTRERKRKKERRERQQEMEARQRLSSLDQTQTITQKALCTKTLLRSNIHFISTLVQVFRKDTAETHKVLCK